MLAAAVLLHVWIPLSVHQYALYLQFSIGMAIASVKGSKKFCHPFNRQRFQLNRYNHAVTTYHHIYHGCPYFQHPVNENIIILIVYGVYKFLQPVLRKIGIAHKLVKIASLLFAGIKSIPVPVLILYVSFSGKSSFILIY